MIRRFRRIGPNTWLSCTLTTLWIAAFGVTGASSPSSPVADYPAGDQRNSLQETNGAARRVLTPTLSARAEAGQNTPATLKPKKPIDWVALFPGFAGATYVNDIESCAGCHEEEVLAFQATQHASAFNMNAPAESNGCETCHGPQSRHVDNPDDPTRELILDPASPRQSGICLQCHEGGSRMSFKSGAHHTSDVGCASCHDVMEKKSERALLLKSTVGETCYQCHAEVRTDANKMSHHPVREGKMDCASCHNAHGATNALLLKPTVNETCATCHAEKRGPFVWEHAPVSETCANCHAPHGSNQRSLLTTKEPFLCLTCHSYGGHINLPRYNRVSNPYGAGCVNCHITTHGSNHPSGAKFTR